MRALTAADLLDLWERGAQAHPVVRPLLVLAVAFPETEPTLLADEPLGRVNARLWAVRDALLGAEVIGCASCPDCGERVEFEIDATELAAGSTPGPDAGATTGGLRPLTLTDLFAAASAPDPVSVLLARRTDGGTTPEDVSVALAAADPDAELLLGLACPSCGRRWAAPLDIGSFLWSELDRLVGETVRDVDVLARCYGWTERAVLELSPLRRRRYVEMARGAMAVAG